MAEVLALGAPPADTGMLVLMAPPPPPPPPSSVGGEAVAADAPAAPAPHTSEEGGPAPAEAKTLADLAREVPNWTLHSDHDLHAFLKGYSADLFARTKDLENLLHDVTAEADAAHVRLKNTFNQFLMLSNNQFIENRVYDEEQEDAFGTVDTSTEAAKEDGKSAADAANGEQGAAAGEPVKEAKAAGETVVSKYRSALDMGLEAMKLFAMMDGEDDDRSDASSQMDTVLDIYNERPLPFIIGTREFLEDETLGLGAAPESDDDSDSSSEESDSEYGSSYSSSDESASSASSAPRQKRGAARRTRGDSEDSMDSSVSSAQGRGRANSLESDTSGLFGRAPPAIEAPPPLPAAQKGSRRRPVFNEDDEDDESDSDSDWTSDSEEEKPSRRTKPAPARPAASESTATATGPPRKTQVFDDSSEDDDSDDGLFGGAPKAAPRAFATDESKPAEKAPAAPSEAGSEDLFGSAPRRRASSRRLSIRRSDSFDSSSDEEGTTGLFGAPAKTPDTTAPPPQGFRLPPVGDEAKQSAPERTKSFFSASDSDNESTVSGLFGRGRSAKEETKKTAEPAGVPVLPPPQARPQRPSLSDDDSSEDEDGGLFGAAPKKQAPPVAATPVVPPRPHVYSDSSDDDEDDDGLFGTKPAPKTSPEPAPRPAAIPAAAPTAPTAAKSSLFNDDEDSDDSDDGGLFGSKTPAQAAPVAAPPVRPALATQPSARPSPIFTQTYSDDDSSDDNDGGLFGAPVKTKPAPQPTATAVPPAVSTAPQLQPRQMSTVSDSSEAESDAGGLFGVPPPRTTAQPPRAAPAPTTAAPVSTPAPAPAVAAVPPPRPLINRQVSSDDSDEWSDDDNGGLFGTASAPSAAKAPAAAPTPAPSQAPAQAPAPAAAPASSLFSAASVPAASAVHPPMPSAVARMNAAQSDEDSDSDWSDGGGLFGPAKK